MNPMLALYDTDPFLLLVAWVLMATVGFFIGDAKGRDLAGAMFGAFLGPIGWLLIAVGPDLRAKCRHCRGAVMAGATHCCHCGQALPPRVPAPVELPPPVKLRTVHCPACDRENQVTPEEFNRGLRCTHCDAGFVPAAA